MTKADDIQPSASVASPGLGIRYIGKEWAYAYSGEIGNATSPTVQLSFHTGSGLLVADISFMGTVSPSAPDGGGVTVFAVNLNDETVAYVKTEGNNEDMPNTFTIPFILPPFSKVEITADSQYSSAGYYTSVHLTGRVYGAT